MDDPVTWGEQDSKGIRYGLLLEGKAGDNTHTLTIMVENCSKVAQRIQKPTRGGVSWRLDNTTASSSEDGKMVTLVPGKRLKFASYAWGPMKQGRHEIEISMVGPQGRYLFQGVINILEKDKKPQVRYAPNEVGF